jgi:hypothetical protein
VYRNPQRTLFRKNLALTLPQLLCFAACCKQYPAPWCRCPMPKSASQRAPLTVVAMRSKFAVVDKVLLTLILRLNAALPSETIDSKPNVSLRDCRLRY